MGYGNGGTAIGQVAGIGGVMGMGQSIAASPRTSVITEQMLRLEAQTESVNQLVSELAGRIDAVLMPPAPQATGANQGNAPHPSVQLGAGLAQMNDRLQMVASRLRDVIERVEL